MSGSDEVRDEVRLANLDQLWAETAPRLLAGGDPWAQPMPEQQQVGADLIEEGQAVPTPRVQAMHEGRRRARARRSEP